MKFSLQKPLNPILLVLLAVVIKLPMLLTGYIQEDAFITWRVARNLLTDGVIGFNGLERISASTTHLYVLVSAFFQLIFGTYFIYPLLVFSSALFAVGTLWLAQIFFTDKPYKQALFVVFLNMMPPALAASELGMEYGILFFLYCGLLYFGLYRRMRWAFLIFPILLLWTRLDAAVFLVVAFLAELAISRKINYTYILGGLIGLGSVVGFNYVYFGEIVNHTITAKKIAYKNLISNDSLQFLLYQWAYYGGLIKKYSLFTLVIFVLFLLFLGYVISRIIRKRALGRTAAIILLAITGFALLKITLFAFLKAYFDWYYWLPRVFLFVIILYYLIEYLPFTARKKTLIIGSAAAVLYLFQMLQSWTIGYMEKNQRFTIAREISEETSGLAHSILLEPAGIIPFYTELYTYDEVGLVNKKITSEMLKDEQFWWINSVKLYRPDYLLTVGYKADSGGSYYRLSEEDKHYFSQHYQLVKAYPIAKIHQGAPPLLRWIYTIRPLGKDYYLYKTKTAR